MAKKQSALTGRINKLEKDIAKNKVRLAQLRRKFEGEPIDDYSFEGPKGKVVFLSDLFMGKSELMLIHNMGAGCAYCTMWADGFNGVLQHLQNRAAFVVVSSDSPETQLALASRRGWKFPFYSSGKTSFKRDMGFETRDGGFIPGVSIFTKDKKGRIHHKSRAEFGPGDNYCIVWDLFDLLPKGAGKWGPQFNY